MMYPLILSVLLNIEVIHLIDALSHVLQVGPIDFDLCMRVCEGSDGICGTINASIIVFYLLT